MKTKGRKRTADNILDEYNTLSSLTSKQILTKDVEFTTRKPRNKKQCFCSKCNGKWVNLRTKDKYEHDHKGQMASLGRLHSEQSTLLPANETPISQVLVELLDSMMSTDTHLSHTSDNDMYEKQNLSFLSRKKGQKQTHFVLLLKVKLRKIMKISKLNMTQTISILVILQRKILLLMMMMTNSQIFLKIIHILFSILIHQQILQNRVSISFGIYRTERSVIGFGQ